MSNTTYSVAALAAALNVPRTTVNDWLVKYEDFIDATAMGKRKVYSARTLTVLQEVARLRDMGKTGAEIEEALEQVMGITPEIAPEKTDEAPAAAPAAENPGDVPPADNSAQLPAVKKFEENAMELAAFIAELRKEQFKSRKRSRTTAFLLFCVIVILVAALGAAIQAVRMQFAERQLEAVNMQKTLKKLNSDFTAELKSQEALRQRELRAAEQERALLKNELARLRESNAVNIKRLTAQLDSERKNRELSEKMWQKEREWRQKERERLQRREEIWQKEREHQKRREEMWQKEREYQKRSEKMLKDQLAAIESRLLDLNQKRKSTEAQPDVPEIHAGDAGK